MTRSAMRIGLQQIALLLSIGCCCCAQETADAPMANLNKETNAKERVRLSEILIATPLPYASAQLATAQEKANNIYAAIQKGEDFAQLARNNSDGPSASLGGDVGYFTRDNLGLLADVAFRLKVGDVSNVIRTKQGFLILKVTDRLPLPGRDSPNNSNPQGLEILTSTLGVDFGPYLNNFVLPTVKKNWYSKIPQAASQKKGKVVLEFWILKDGSISGLKVVESSGDLELDRAAYGAVTASNPFRPLPPEFKGPSVGLRFRYYYNMATNTGSEISTAQVVTISPSNVRVAARTSVQFSAGSGSEMSHGWLWSVRGQSCRKLSCGSISSEGLYTAPKKPPKPPEVKIFAVSSGNSKDSAFTVVTIVPTPRR